MPPKGKKGKKGKAKKAAKEEATVDGEEPKDKETLLEEE